MLLEDLKGKKVGMCVSGGLDSKTVTKLFKENGIDVVCFTADVLNPMKPTLMVLLTKWLLVA